MVKRMMSFEHINSFSLLILWKISIPFVVVARNYVICEMPLVQSQLVLTS